MFNMRKLAILCDRPTLIDVHTDHSKQLFSRKYPLLDVAENITLLLTFCMTAPKR